MIDITMIGTGALQPLPGRALACAAVTMSGRTLLLDCGEGTQAAARGAGVSLLKIDMIALTHYHGDHTYGLPGLLQSMGMAGRTETLYITGPAGLEEAMQPFMMLCPYLPYEVKLIELPGEGLCMNTLHASWPREASLRFFASEHRMPSRGYRLELARPGKFMPQKAKELGVPVNDWKRLQRGESVQVDGVTITPDQVMGAPRQGLAVAFTGDTCACKTVLDGMRGATLAICEGTYGEDEQGELAAEHGHMTFRQAAELAAKAGVRTLWLTHYSPMFMDPAEYEVNAKRVFEGAVCGFDGMKTTLTFE